MIKTLGDVFSNRSKKWKYKSKSNSKSAIPRPFNDDFYLDWIETLNTTLLPLLRRSIHRSSPSILATDVSLLQNHFLTYFAALDTAASNDVAFLLSPPWRNSLEKPFLWLGDFHPSVFTNLLRAFLKTSAHSHRHHPYSYVSLLKKKDFTPDAWGSPSPAIVERLEEVERGLRLMVPELVSRARDAQVGMARRLAEDWMEEGGKGVGEVMGDHLEEMMGVLVHANRIRRSVVGDLVGVMDVYQAALFFEGLAQFYVGFRDHQLLAEFERCEADL